MEKDKLNKGTLCVHYQHDAQQGRQLMLVRHIRDKHLCMAAWDNQQEKQRELLRLIKGFLTNTRVDDNKLLRILLHAGLVDTTERLTYSTVIAQTRHMVEEPRSAEALVEQAWELVGTGGRRETP